jgi:hypothetical protein
MVEKIESGTRIVIQYNVYIDPYQMMVPSELMVCEEDNKKRANSTTKADSVKRMRVEDEVEDEADEESSDEDDEDDEDEEDEDEDEGRDYDVYLDYTKTITQAFQFPQVSMAGIANVLALLDKKIDSSGTFNIAIPLFHRYSAASIKPEYLKLADRQLFNAIAKTGKYLLGLSPVTIDVVSDYEGRYERSGYSANFTDPIKACYQWDTESNAMQESTIEKGHFLNRRKCQYIVTKRENTSCLEGSSYKEYTGNEAEEGRYKYYVGVMVVCRK